MACLERDANRLQEVSGALGRINAGSFGVCVTCEKTINALLLRGGLKENFGRQRLFRRFRNRCAAHSRSVPMRYKPNDPQSIARRVKRFALSSANLPLFSPGGTTGSFVVLRFYSHGASCPGIASQPPACILHANRGPDPDLPVG